MPLATITLLSYGRSKSYNILTYKYRLKDYSFIKLEAHSFLYY
jgi:hypothetical protein